MALEDSPRFDGYKVRRRFSLINWIIYHTRFLLVAAGILAVSSVLILIFAPSHFGAANNQVGGMDGCVVDANGNPLTATVWVDNSSRPTYADGCFFFPSLSSGGHQVRIEVAGKQLWQTTVNIQAGLATGLQNIVVNP